MNILICGITGHMGSLIKKEIKKKYPTVMIKGYNHNDSFIEAFKDIDLLIDFSSYDISKEIISYAIENKINVISGTTGYSDDEIIDLKNRASTKFYWTPNYSLGYNFMLDESQVLKRLYKDMTIKETHNITKKDKPSGTARIISSLTNYDINRIISSRVKRNIASHEISFFNEFETMVIKHTVRGKRAYLNGFMKKLEEIFGSELNA